MPDIGFKLFGDSAALERAIVRSKNAVGDLDQNLKGVNKVMSTLGKVAGAFGITQAFSAAIDKAQQLRDESLKNGTAIDGNTAALARYGDTLDRLKEGAVKMGVSMLGSLSNFGERLGAAIGGEDIDAARAEEAASKKRMELTLKDMGIRKEIFEAKKKQAYEEADTTGKINLMLKDQADLMATMNNLAADENKRLDAKRQYQLNNLDLHKLEMQAQKEKNEIVAKETEELDHQKKIRKEAADSAAKEAAEKRKAAAAAAKKLDSAKSKLDEAESDRSKISLGDLANTASAFSPGVSVEMAQNGEQARKIFELQRKAKEATAAGDLEGSKKLWAEADDLRGGLSNILKSDDGRPFGDLRAAITDAQAGVGPDDYRSTGLGGIAGRVSDATGPNALGGNDPKSSKNGDRGSDEIIKKLDEIKTVLSGKFVNQ